MTKLHKIWLKLWRNRRHNRFWIVLGNRLFLRVPVRFRRFAPRAIPPAREMSRVSVSIDQSRDSFPLAQAPVNGV